MNRCVWLEKNRYRVLCSLSNGYVQAERCLMKWRSNAKTKRSLQIRCVKWRCVKEMVALLGFRNLVRIIIDCIFTLSRDYIFYFITERKNNSVQPRGTTKLNLLDQQSTTTSYGLQSFIYVAPQVWNTLPDDIRTSETLITFKRAIRNITVWCRYIYFLKTRLIICACVVILYFPTLSILLHFLNQIFTLGLILALSSYSKS